MDPLLQVFIYLLLGASAGFLGGMLGVGGGIIVVPTLIFVFEWLGIFDDPLLPSNSLVLCAVGTSMASIIFTTGTSALAQYRRGNIDWHLVWVWIPFLVLGAMVASLIAEYIPILYLKLLIASVLVAIAIFFLLDRLPEVKNTRPHKMVPFTFSTSSGLVCGLVGLGGGIILVPALLVYKTPITKAAATGSVGGFCVSAVATIGYGFTGLDIPVPQSIGYVYLPALVPIALASILVAPMGVRVGQKLSSSLFRNVFGVLLVVVCGRLYYSIFFA